MAPKVNQTQSTQNYVTTPQTNNAGGGKTVYNVPIGGDVAYREGYGDNINKNQSQNLTPEEQRKLNAIYKRIEALCHEQSIDPNFAKSEKLLERIAGVSSSKELVNLKDEEINFIIKTLESHLGWGDGLGFGKKDKNDLNKLVEDLHKKFGYEKTGGSRFGQWWYNVKNSAKILIGTKTIDNCNTPEEISNYFKEEYLSDIKNLSVEEKKEKYDELLKDFFYTFNNIKDKNKQLAMVKAIENLAANDRAIIIEVIERIYSDDKKALALFGKALNENFETIVTTKDAMNQTVTKEGATKISHTAFKHMSEADVKEAIETLKNNTKEFYEKYGEKIKELRARQANGEKLNPEETELLEKLTLKEENVHIAGYTGATTGTYCNNNIQLENKVGILTQISNDTEELGIQEEVFQSVQEFIESNPEIVKNEPEAFQETMNQATNNKYEGVVKHQSSNTNPEVQQIQATQGRTTQEKATHTNPIKETKVETNNTTTEPQIGFAERTATDTTKVDLLASQLPTANSKETPIVAEKSVKTQENKSTKKDIVEISKGSSKDFNEYVKDNGAFQTVVEIYNNLNNISNRCVLTTAQKLYSMLNADRQEEVLRSIKSAGGFNELLAQTSDQVILKLDTNFNSFYTKQQVEEAQKKAQERMPHGLA